MVNDFKARLIGKIDGILTLLFMAISTAIVELASWALTALPQINDMDWGEYNWLKVPVIIVIGAILKGIDRKKHEDPTTDAHGLVNTQPLDRLLK